MRVKILWTDNLGGCYECGGAMGLVGGNVEWEEISDEDLKYLQKNLQRLTNPAGGWGRPFLLVDDGFTVSKALQQIEGVIAKAKADELKEEKAREARRKQLAKTEKERKMKKLQKLQKELGIK